MRPETLDEDDAWGGEATEEGDSAGEEAAEEGDSAGRLAAPTLPAEHVIPLSPDPGSEFDGPELIGGERYTRFTGEMSGFTTERDFT
jgi:hypothetical protein